MDQWADVSTGNTVHLGEMGHPDVYVDSRDGLTISGGYAGDSVDVPDGRCRHALAAIALYGQKFGFTREDVTYLRWAFDDAGRHDLSEGLDSIRRRIEALLPPEL